LSEHNVHGLDRIQWLSKIL